jgi:hypothetical protein
MLRISASRRYFEHADGTPFFWLGDTWWMGLSDRLSWNGFQQLTADRKAKGFTLVQLVAGLVPYEESPPSDPGFCNEGGCVWESSFQRINPRYFDAADRRIQYLVDEGVVPAIVGAWNELLGDLGVEKMKQHWRYLIARYGAYPVFWIVGGEVVDPPESVAQQYSPRAKAAIRRGWTEVAGFIRATDPYHHPITVHESPPPWDVALRDESHTDFDLFQSGHYGWASIATAVVQMNLHYARPTIIKPIVQGEIGYEKLGETHFEDFQRTAFWLSMLNGAAGHTYGANGVWEAYTGDRPLHRIRHSFLNWDEGMKLPGSYQIGLGAKLLRQYPWWQFMPHPEWVTPHGTTLLDSEAQIGGFAFGSPLPNEDEEPKDRIEQLEADYPGGEWKARNGTFRLPYAAGVPGEVRFVYVPAIGLYPPPPPTILGLEPGRRYHAFWWEPSTGTRFDLGTVERPSLGSALFEDAFTKDEAWELFKTGNKAVPDIGISETETFRILRGVRESSVVATVEATSAAGAVLILRYQDHNNFIAAIYSPERAALFVVERRDGAYGPPMGKIAIQGIGEAISLSMEVRGAQAAAKVTDGARTYTTPIIDVSQVAPGSAGVMCRGGDLAHQYANFRLWQSPTPVNDVRLDRRLSDSRGVHRGDLVGTSRTVGGKGIPGWSSFGIEKHILLDAYRPERLPSTGDWILVLERCRGC